MIKLISAILVLDSIINIFSLCYNEGTFDLRNSANQLKIAFKHHSWVFDYSIFKIDRITMKNWSPTIVFICNIFKIRQAQLLKNGNKNAGFCIILIYIMRIFVFCHPIVSQSNETFKQISTNLIIIAAVICAMSSKVFGIIWKK